MGMYLDVLKPTKIPGESQSPNTDWKDKIEIQHMGYDVSVRTSMEAGTGLASAGATVGHLQISKVMDKSTPLLWYHLCAGLPIDYMVIRVSRPGLAGGSFGGLFEAETYELENVIVSSYSTSGSAGMGGLPTESWSFSFTKINEHYQDVDKKGVKKAPQAASYDFSRGVADMLGQ